ncbi:MAG: 3-keto-5-aminohexanoate cleavage protein [Polyangiales bacterium]
MSDPTAGLGKVPTHDVREACVVTCAVTGTLANRDQCKNIPYTPEEIGEECRRAYEAGATVAHIHARHDDGQPTFSPAVFAAIKREVTKRSPIILNYSTGTILEDVTEQTTYIRESRPEIAALNMGTMNYAKYSERRKNFVFDMVFPNTYGKIIKMLSAMNEAGVKPELECFDTGHTHGLWPLIDMGILKAPLQYSFILNVLGGIPATIESLQLQTKLMVPGSEWEVIGISRPQWRMIAGALVLGGNIRCGLEDNFYLPDGTVAQSNGELVDRAVRMVRDVGRRPATLEETYQILSMKKPDWRS